MQAPQVNAPAVHDVAGPLVASTRERSSPVGWQLTSITLTVIAVSIVLHGITVTPLMNWRERRRR